MPPQGKEEDTLYLLCAYIGLFSTISLLLLVVGSVVVVVVSLVSKPLKEKPGLGCVDFWRERPVLLGIWSRSQTLLSMYKYVYMYYTYAYARSV